ncbi:MAG TPA: hypothetical protein VGB75_10445 [Jatrophihabitans sp.]|uniref:hypothetical protein n=1 Tax=Jatrophihabitans sp. TaxID=1932789 RepID=UPI002EF18E9F
MSAITPGAGLDPSWMTALNLAPRQGLRFGPDLLFTMGPWGFLDHPHATSRANLVLGTVFAVFAVSLAWLAFSYLFRRVTTVNRAAVAAAGLVALIAQANSMSAVLLMATGALALLYLSAERPPGQHGWLPPTLAAEAAVLVQVKFSVGVVATAIAAVCLAFGAGHKGRQAAVAGLSWLLATTLAWLLAGQALTDYPGWFAGSVQIAAGYTEAMALEDKPNVLPYAVLGAVVAVIGGYFVRSWRAEGLRPLIGVLLVSALLLYLGFREVAGRHQPGRNPFFFLTAAPVLAWSLAARGSAANTAKSASTAKSIVTGLAVRDPAGNLAFRAAVLVVTVLLAARSWLPTEPSQAMAAWADRVQVVTDARYQKATLSQAQRQAQQAYGLSGELRAAVADHPVAVDSFESSLPWAYDLTWRPVPVFQTYAAYTLGLDRRNAEALSRAAGDQRVLRSAVGAIDGRNPLWDSPRYVLTEVCGYRPELSDARWLLLRKSTDRCRPATAMPARTLARGARIDLPEVGARQLLVMSFTPSQVNPLIRLGRAVDKSFSPLTVSCGQASYRVPRALAGGPLIVRMPAAAGWPAGYLGDFSCPAIAFNEAGSVRFSALTLSTG